MVSSEKKQIVGGIAWKMAERLTSQGVTFLVSIILARLLMPEEFGLVAMIQVFIAVANIFVSVGISSSLIQKKDADDLDFSTMFYCSLGLSVILYLVLFFTAPFIAEFYKMPKLELIVRVYSLILILYSYNSIQNAWVSRHMVFKKFFLTTSFGTIGSGIIGVILAYSGFGVWAIVAQTMSNTLINMFVMRCIVTWRPKLIFSFARAKKLMSYGLNILIASLLGTGCNQIRQLVIGRYFSAADLAFFNRGNQFPHLFLSNIDTTINTVLFPAMSNHSDDPDRVKAMTKKSIRISSYVLFFAMGSLAVCAEPLVRALLTDKWIECVPFIQLICVADMISTVSDANRQAIKALGRSDISLKLEMLKKPVFLLMVFVSANISVMAMAVCMPLYSLYAAIVNMFPNKKLMKYGHLEQVKDFIPAATLTLFMALVVYPISLLDLNEYFLLIIQITMCIVVYLGLSYLFKIESLGYIVSTLKEFRKKK